MIDLDALRAELEAAGAHVTTDAPAGQRAIQAHWPHDRNIKLGDRIHATIEVDPDGWIAATRGHLNPALLAIIARHVSPQPAPDRAALAERMAEAIEQQFDLGYTATAIDFAHVALAAVEAAGWGPPVVTPEPPAEARDVLRKAVHKRIIDGWNGDETTEELHKAGADAGLAVLRAKGFAVVRTADVEALLGVVFERIGAIPEWRAVVKQVEAIR